MAFPNLTRGIAFERLRSPTKRVIDVGGKKERFLLNVGTEVLARVSDDKADCFCRKLRYVLSGSLVLDAVGFCMFRQSPMETLMEKLLLAGWIAGAGTIAREGGMLRGVLWTDAGLTRTVAMSMFLEEVGLTDAELLCLRRIIAEQGPRPNADISP